MRTPLIVLTFTALALTLYACGGAQKKGNSSPTETQGTLPGDYKSWGYITPETIVREEEDDDGKVIDSSAVELYGKIVGELGVGSILIKETYSGAEPTSAALERIDLMRRIGGDTNAGWRFESYDPKTKASLGQAEATCVNCHSLQAQNDYLFSAREDALNPTLRDSSGDTADSSTTEGSPATE